MTKRKTQTTAPSAEPARRPEPSAGELAGRFAHAGGGRRQSAGARQRASGDRGPSAVSGQPDGRVPWADRTTRITFYVPRELADAIELERARSGRSKSRIIVDAIREHLAE
jgi:hypothetical protein